MAVRAVRAVRAAFRRLQRGKMAAERPEAAAAAASGPGDYASWAPAELRHCLGSIGAAVHGSREELLERLQSYTMQTGVVLSRPTLRPEEGEKAPPPPLPTQGQHQFGDKAKEQELLEQQKRAAVLLEQERQQQEMAKMAPPIPRPPEVTPMGARAPLPPRGGASMGSSMGPMGAARPRGPPPHRETTAERRRTHRWGRRSLRRWKRSFS